MSYSLYDIFHVSLNPLAVETFYICTALIQNVQYSAIDLPVIGAHLTRASCYGASQEVIWIRYMLFPITSTFSYTYLSLQLDYIHPLRLTVLSEHKGAKMHHSQFLETV